MPKAFGWVKALGGRLSGFPAAATIYPPAASSSWRHAAL